MTACGTVAWNTTQVRRRGIMAETTTAPAGNRGLSPIPKPLSTRKDLHLMVPQSRPATHGCVPVNEIQTKLYQQMARARFEGAAERQLMPWTWIVTTCEQQCLNPGHLIARTPQVISYPAGVCIYCGMPSGTKDHLLPRNLTGDARRVYVAVVPACASCNSAIYELPDPSVTIRRKRAHDSIRRRKRALLNAPDWTDDQLREFGPKLRTYMEAKRSERRAILSQLAWPHDPMYDLRAFEKSGVENPYALGLIEVA